MNITARQIDIVIELARENVIDPRDGEDYEDIADEQTAAIEAVEAYLNDAKMKSLVDRCLAWNVKHPIGTPVTRYKLVDPLSDPVETKTRSLAWVTPSGSCLVKVDGVAGGVLLESVVPKT